MHNLRSDRAQYRSPVIGRPEQLAFCKENASVEFLLLETGAPRTQVSDSFYLNFPDQSKSLFCSLL